MAELYVNISFNGDDFRRLQRQIEMNLFLHIYDDFDNLESMLDIRGITYEDE